MQAKPDKSIPIVRNLRTLTCSAIKPLKKINNIIYHQNTFHCFRHRSYISIKSMVLGLISILIYWEIKYDIKKRTNNTCKFSKL